MKTGDGLWLGFSLNIVRTIPQCVVTFTLYEYLSRRLQLMCGLSAPDGRTQKQVRKTILARTRSEARA